MCGGRGEEKRREGQRNREEEVDTDRKQGDADAVSHRDSQDE